MKHLFCSRFFLFMVTFAWGIALTAQPQIEAAFAAKGNSEATHVALRLAGLPRPNAVVGQRIFFTVQEDVFQNDSLLIAAGAYANGRIHTIRHTNATLFLKVEPKAVQTVGGEMMGLNSELISLEIDLKKAVGQYVPFALPLTAEAGQSGAVLKTENVCRMP